MPPPKPSPQKTKSKSRVGVMLREGVGLSKARNRSADLIKLEERFHGFIKNVKNLTAVLKSHYGSMVQLQKSRMAVAQEVAKLAFRSPLEECISEMPSPDKPASQVCSYASVHAQVAEKSKSYISKYAQFVVEYCIEWEKVLTNRISVGVKKAEGLRRDLDHYQQKVESLRQSTNQYMAKGKQVDAKTADRLSRNEEKFMKAKQEYDVFATDLCILIEEVTERGWRDLHPLLIKLAQFDMTMSDDEAKMMNNLNQVVSQLKSVASQNGLQAQPRLKEIESKKASELNTGSHGGDLRIEDGSAGSGSVFGTNLLSQALPPGSVGSQGSGGFPVQIGESEDRTAPARTSSFGSYDSAPNPLTTSSGSFMGGGSDWKSGGSTYNVSSTQRTMRSAPNSAGAPSTMEILQYSSAAAPPPTMDQLNDANSPYPMTRSASGGLPPLGPSGYSSKGGGGNDNDSAYGSNYGGGSAYGDPYASDNLSAYSGASAPAPVAPPPPPPVPPSSAPPPPPAPMSMYPAPSSGGQPSWNSSYPQQQQTNFGQPSYGQQPQMNYGQPSYGQQQQTNYGQPSYGQQQQTNFGQPSYGQQPPQQQWGQPQQNRPNNTNPFGPGPGGSGGGTNPFG